MGVFDSINVAANNVINLPLPADEYQTQSLDNKLWGYRISEEGKLVVDTKAADYGNGVYAKEFEDHLSNPEYDLCKINRGEYSGVVDIYGTTQEKEEWKDYTLVIENNLILLIMNYDIVVYVRNESDTSELMDKVTEYYRKNESSDVVQDIMFQKMMSTKHLLANKGKE